MRARFLLDILLGPSHIIKPVLTGKVDDEGRYQVSLGENQDKDKTYTIIDVPDHQPVKFMESLASHSRLVSPLYQGYLIELNGHDSFEDYFRARFNAKGARNLRRQGKKLIKETFARKVTYYGNTERETLDMLFEKLGQFLEKRFEQKEVSNYEIPLLPLYKKMFQKLLPEKKAVIFSLLDGNDPIALGIGFIYGDTLYLFNIAYDMDYSQYGPGNQIMIEAVAWCFDNGITRVDMGRGDFLHKRKWVNTSYTYTQIDLYDPKNIGTRLRALLSWTLNTSRFYGIRFLKKLQVHQLAKRWFIWKYRVKGLLSAKKNHSQKNISES
ncbi:GNAT family N-acetyltransferase [Muricauda sp. HICW]|uniref:GNAT family N-acetyltransferase n=1 Tax=Flagellimonas chongwuensis TaxID=2697365 RepID=A0A850NES5_9FLAO|nr:GNAT family N-acetyltransferase [Allomuricauda chongwuensis]NVN19343.1 GNAT family N-acetyltransferase [Allomuricauda chongwuensis]